MSYLYFTLDHAINEHDFIIDQSGGRHGQNDIGLLESVLGHIQNDMYYQSIEDKTTHLCYSINKNHAFTDGNKRSSIVLAAYFLEINGFSYCISRFMREMENFAVYVADNIIGRELLHEIIISIIYEEDYSEGLKVKIANCLSQNIRAPDPDIEDDLF